MEKFYNVKCNLDTIFKDQYFLASVYFIVNAYEFFQNKEA